MKSTAETQTALCIAGAHRSGTSMVTRLLHCCGLELGPESELMPAQPDNPDGFWEHLGFVALNDELLNALGGAWDLPPNPDENFTDAWLDPLRVKARLLIESFDSARVWGWKDPRNSLTLPFWQNLLPSLKTLIIVRNPLEVAYSLRERNGTSYSFGLRLWEIYNKHLLWATTPKNRIVSHYDSFFDHPQKELRRILSFIGLPKSKMAKAAALISSERRHTHFTTQRLLDAQIPPRLLQLYQQLSAQAYRITDAELAASSKVAKQRSRKGKGSDAALAAPLPASGALNLAVLEAELAKQRSRKGKESHAGLAAPLLASGGLNLAVLEAEKLRKELAAHQVELQRLNAHISQIFAAVHRSEAELKQRDAIIAANNAELKRLNAERAEYQSQMEASAARHEKQRAEYQAQIHQFAAKLQDSQSEMEKIREHFVQTNQLLHTKSIGLTESEERATELTAKLRRNLHDLKKLTRLLGSLEDVAIRLRSSRRWKLANPMVSLRSKFLSDSEPAGYDHLDKVVAAYRRWRIAHPELDDLDEQIQRLRRQAALKDSTTELPTGAETLPPAEVSSASERTDTVAPVAPKPIEFPVLDKVEVNSIDSEYPDVAAANVEPLTHLVSRGRTEERKTTKETISFEAYRPAFDIPREPTVFADPAFVPPVKAIAFYLPQFHRIPENDCWWGDGFTDWNNVRVARPNFAGHYQPHVPIGLGYYDLREPDVLQKQTELARVSGIYGFCFYYYWFGGKVLLDLPIRRMLESGKPDFPFCICWANENWTRRWDGLENEVLIAQSHSPEDDVSFIRHLEHALFRRNYIRVRGKPVLLVYRPSLLPNSLETTERWRDYFRSNGHGELHLVMVRSFYDQTAPGLYGFDAAVQFPPHFPTPEITTLIKGKDEKFGGIVYDYLQLRKAVLEQWITNPGTEKTYAAVMPSWDNTARRRSEAVIWANSSPESYYEWLSATVERVQKKEESDERLIFINAWNEWSEGCHLEPDEKYGHAWLNATTLALRPATHSLPRTSPAQNHPEPPRTETIQVPALPARLKLAISVLFYHREDLIRSFLQSLLPHILIAESQGDVTCSLNLAFNYQPSPGAIAEINEIIAEKLPLRGDAVHILENGFNVGFGAGHNLIFDKSDSDIFLILNSDVRVADKAWLPKLVHQFRGSDAAIIGLIQNASRLREDGCGIPIEIAGDEFDFVDGSVLAIRSDLGRRFGLFSPSFDYFYFEDVDLCLRYRQMGFQIALLDAPYEHERSSSSQLLPRFAVESVLNRNRARFFEKWGKYLRARILSNRIGVRFLDIDRGLQCASLPAILNLLSEHKTAAIDLWGVHEQLAEFFQHPRIRLIPSWQTLQENDYARYYDLGANQSEVPHVHDIANRMGCDPDFLGAKAYLESLGESSRRKDVTSRKRAMLYIARKSPLFEGREPDVESFAAAVQMLRGRNFEVSCYTDYGTFENQALHGFAAPDWKHAALCSGMELLEEIVAADLLVTSDNWISELGQLLQKRTFLWLGATSGQAAIWDFERSSFFADQSLPCLGCYHQFGRNHHNVCLRGDVACMRPQLAQDFLGSLETFLNGRPLKAATVYPNRSNLTSHRTMPSTELSLEHWPGSAANSVLVLTPVHSQLERRVLDRAKELANRALKGMRKCRVIHDDSGEAPERQQCTLTAVRGQPHPHRQAAMASLRQNMVERHLQDERWIFWVDADIIDYPAFLIEQLIQRAEGGIAAPLVLMEGEITEPLPKDGFGPGRFFDIAGFVENSRWARFTAPYFDQPGPVYRLDSVGSCYLINADLYRIGATHTIDPASQNFLDRKETWWWDAIARNQRGPANAYTEHYSVCQFAIRQGLPVQAFADLVAFHQKV